eukprot:scaffold922_cov327-Pinguiococcus_pyrenoidosus.AAC.24
MEQNQTNSLRRTCLRVLCRLAALIVHLEPICRGGTWAPSSPSWLPSPPQGLLPSAWLHSKSRLDQAHRPLSDPWCSSELASRPGQPLGSSTRSLLQQSTRDLVDPTRTRSCPGRGRSLALPPR